MQKSCVSADEKTTTPADIFRDRFAWQKRDHRLRKTAHFGRCGGGGCGRNRTLFLLQALVIWALICLPANIVTLVLFSSSNSGEFGETVISEEVEQRRQTNETIHADDVGPTISHNFEGKIILALKHLIDVPINSA